MTHLNEEKGIHSNREQIACSVIRVRRTTFDYMYDIVYDLILAVFPDILF